MMVNVFDDRKGSIVHIFAGGLTRFIPVVFLIFIAYEFIEHIYLRGKEREANFLGDIFEFSFGVMLMTVLYEFTGCVSVIIYLAFVVGLWYAMGKWKEG